MAKKWADTSTEAIEFYRKEFRAQAAMVFRMRDRGVGYSVCVAGTQVRCADTTFASLEEAQAWADRELGIPPQERAVGA